MSGKYGRILAVGVWTFVLSAALSSSSESIALHFPVGFSIAVLMAIIATGIAFDIVGTSTAAASEAPMNAMAANRVYGASEALSLVRNAPAVANLCNDVVGDICGTVSGAVGATIVLNTVGAGPGLAARIAPTVVIALVSALTVAGKAAGKQFAIDQANDVVLLVGRIVASWNKLFRCNGKGKSRNKSNRKGRSGQ